MLSESRRFRDARPRTSPRHTSSTRARREYRSDVPKTRAERPQGNQRVIDEIRRFLNRALAIIIRARDRQLSRLFTQLLQSQIAIMQ